MCKVAHRRRLQCIFAWGLAAASACYLPDPCDDNQTFVRDQHSCVATSTTTKDPDGVDPPACDDSQFGRLCSTAQECACDTDFCATNPGESVGFCTIVDCLSAPESCGVGFVCLDVSDFTPELSSLCVPE